MSSANPGRLDADDSPVGGTNVDAATAMSHGFVCLRDEIGDGRIRLAVSGELDIVTAPELDDALRLAQQSARNVTLDLRRLDFIDCPSLAVIITAADRASATGGSFRVVRGPPRVHRLFTATEIDRRIDITPTG